MTTRRSFLKLLGIGSAAAVVAPSILEMPAEAVERCEPVPCPPVEDVRIEAVYRVVEDPNHWSIWQRNEITVRMEPPPQFVKPGAFHAPMAPYYDLPSSHRPVMDSLPIFTAPRDGIKYQPRHE